MDTIWIHWVSGYYISQVHSILAKDVLHHLLRTTFKKSENKCVFPFNHLLLREPARSVMFGKHQNLAKKCALTNYIYMSRSVFHTLGNLEPEPESCLSLRRKRSRWRISRTLEQSLSARGPKIWKDVRKKFKNQIKNPNLLDVGQEDLVLGGQVRLRVNLGANISIKALFFWILQLLNRDSWMY